MRSCSSSIFVYGLFSIHVVANDRISSFLEPNSILLCIYAPHFLYLFTFSLSLSLLSHYDIFLVVLGFWVVLRASCLLGRHATTWAVSPVPFSFGYFGDMVSLFAQASLCWAYKWLLPNPIFSIEIESQKLFFAQAGFRLQCHQSQLLKATSACLQKFILSNNMFFPCPDFLVELVWSGNECLMSLFQDLS
jgi:hypothetical protein